MPDIDVIAEGDFTIETVGPVKEGTAKSSGKPYKIFGLQFKDDAQWYDCYWSRPEAPKVGEVLKGKKEYNKDFKNHQFNMGFAGAKSNWNPAASNAQVMNAAVAVVNGFLTLKPEHLEAWEKRRKEGQTALAQYMETVVTIAGSIKQEVIKLGGEGTKTAEKTSTAPQADGDPGAQPPPDDEFLNKEEIDLGPM